MQAGSRRVLLGCWECSISWPEGQVYGTIPSEKALNYMFLICIICLNKHFKLSIIFIILRKYQIAIYVKKARFRMQPCAYNMTSF